MEVPELQRLLHDVVGHEQEPKSWHSSVRLGTSGKSCRPAAVPMAVSKDVPP